MNFSTSILFLDISHNENENEMSENLIYIGSIYWIFICNAHFVY